MRGLSGLRPIKAQTAGWRRSLLALGLAGLLALCGTRAALADGPEDQAAGIEAAARAMAEAPAETPEAAPEIAAEAALPAPLPPAPDAVAALDAHFKAISADDYMGADKFFSEAFLRAFKADVEKLRQYYIARHEQLARGWEVIESGRLPDDEHETALVVVDFGPPDPDAAELTTERMYYYLVREKAVNGTPGIDSEGRAWRIDIFDALRYDTLAEARRRPYLYTAESWPEDAGRELKSRQGLFRLQWALDSYFVDKQAFPPKLIGGDSKKDELLSGNYLTGSYPPSGYNGRGMAVVGFSEKSAGDFSYIPVDRDGNGMPEAYWLLLHGKDPANFYFKGYDTVYVLSSSEGGGQFELAQAFADYWISQGGAPLEYSAVLPRQPQLGMLGSTKVNQPVAEAADAAADAAASDPAEATAEPADGQPGEDAADPGESAEASKHGSLAGAYFRSGAERLLNWIRSGSPQGDATGTDSAGTSPVNPLSLLGPLKPFRIWSFGF